MNSLSWKPLALFGSVLLIAIGLQAGSIKMMINLSQPDEPAAEMSNAGHATSSARPSKPEVTVTDPPYLANLEQEPDPAPSPEQATEPSPEAASQSPSVTEVPSPVLSPSNIPPPIELESETPAETPANAQATPPTTSVEAATLTSRIPPQIELEASASTLLEPDWLEARDPNHYTVQLYSGKDLDRLREIAASQSIATDGQRAYFITPSRSGPWYSLVIGDYPDFTAAQAVAAQIAAQSGTIKPWIRRFSEIQARMR